MRVVVLGDLGGAGGYHAGDEAMAEAVVDGLAEHEDRLTVVAVTGDEADTRDRYGWDTVPRIGFAGLADDAARDSRLESVLEAAGGSSTALAWDDPAWKVIHAVGEADAVVISGGGNLSSTWPDHVYERAALAGIAARFTTPHVVTGQTLGPHLTARHGELVSSVLTSAALVAAREQPSYDLALRLGVPAARLARVVDDAAYLDTSTLTEPLPQAPYIAATFAPATGFVTTEDYVRAIAAMLDAVAATSGLPVLLVPHHATRDGERVTGDLTVHGAIADAVTTAQVDVLEPVSARRAAQLVAGARLVLSTRYHPVVFAAAAGVPAVGIGVDAYTSTKIHGALANYGAGALAVSVASLVRGELPALVDSVLQREDDVRAHLARAGAVREAEREAWWAAVHAAFTVGSAPRPVPFAEVAELDPTDATAVALREWSEVVSSSFESERLAMSQERAATTALRDRVDLLERERADLAAELALARDEVDTLRTGARAAYELASRAWPLEHADDRSGPAVEALRSEIAAIYSTRTFRYLERPRLLYRRLRSR